MRLFFALPAPGPLQEAVRTWEGPAVPGLRRTPPERLHLTLAFLGATSPDRGDRLSTVAAEAARACAPLSLETADLGAFPRPDRARVLWWGLRPAPELDALAGHLRRGLEASGLPFDPKPFRAHLTLGRLHPPGPLPPLDPPARQGWTAGALVLYESLPTSSGPRYESRGEWPFTGGEPPISPSPGR